MLLPELSRFPFGQFNLLRSKSTHAAEKHYECNEPRLWISLFVIALFAGLSVTQAQTGALTDVVTAISDLENGAVKADLAGDAAFYEKVLAEDWTRGDSDGTYYTKPDS